MHRLPTAAGVGRRVQFGHVAGRFHLGALSAVSVTNLIGEAAKTPAEQQTFGHLCRFQETTGFAIDIYAGLPARDDPVRLRPASSRLMPSSNRTDAPLADCHSAIEDRRPFLRISLPNSRSS